ncbi:MAG TPA: hypothetical protein VG722_02485 [Tepidisphaeraceae bacterium]|nr:hypothetical protein [Tepidisphaeraceae bacterium]
MFSGSPISRLVRLGVYASVAIGSMASVPAIIRKAQQAIGPMADEYKIRGEQPTTASAANHASPGTISIQPAGPHEAEQRNAELAKLRAKLAGVRPSE